MATEELQAVEDDLAEQLQQHSEALHGVRDAMQADPENAELVQVTCIDGAISTGIVTSIAPLQLPGRTCRLSESVHAVHIDCDEHTLCYRS